MNLPNEPFLRLDFFLTFQLSRNLKYLWKYCYCKSLFVLIIGIFCGIISCLDSKKTKLGAGSFPASEFPNNLEWFNVKKPMSIKDFKGRVLVLFFWSGSNFKSLEILNNFKGFEALNRDKISVIAVHSPKFKGEANSDYVKNTILKNKIDLVVIQDPNFTIWRTYGINNWNSLLIIGEDNKVIGRYSIDKNLLNVDPIFERLLNFDLPHTTFEETEENKILEKYKYPESILSFPEKIVSDDSGKILYISDSNHNRILIVNRETGFIQEVIGNGNIGFENGSYSQSTFNYPTGLTIYNNNLYIIDRNNHSLRRVDLEKKIVTLFSGTGKKGDEIVQSGFAPVTSFSFPYDITKDGSTLYLSNTGFNQYIKISTISGKIESLFSEKKDNNFNPEFFSKVGMSFYRDTIYSTDSSSASLKSVIADFPTKVKILIGNKEKEYGDTDGEIQRARLQFPKGIFTKDDSVYIADSLNHKIKVYDIRKKTTTTLAGTGKHGSRNGSFLESSFHEPSNLYLYGSELFVADTNNHSIRILDLNSKKVSNLYLRTDEDFILESKKKISSIKDTYPHKSLFTSPGVFSIKLKLKIDKNYIWDKDAAFYFHISSSDSTVLDFSKNNKNIYENFNGETQFFPTSEKEGSTEINIQSVIYFCEKENPNLCFFKKFKITSIIKILPTGKDKPVFNLTIPIINKKEEK